MRRRRDAHPDTHADEPVDRIAVVFGNFQCTMVSDQCTMCAVQSSTSSFRMDMSSPRPATIYSHHNLHRDTIAGIDDYHTSIACRTLQRMNTSTMHCSSLCMATAFYRDHNNKHARFPSHNHHIHHDGNGVHSDGLHNSGPCRTAHCIPNRLFDSIASFSHSDRNHIFASQSLDKVRMAPDGIYDENRAQQLIQIANEI